MAEKTKKEQDRNKILAVIGVLVVAAVILVALSFTKSQNNPPAENNGVDSAFVPEVSDEELVSQEWTWINTQMNDGTETIPSTEGSFTLTFQTDGRVVATTDCNGANGSYELGDDNSITFGPMATTMMFCEASNETDFYSQLAEVGSYAIQDGQLWLMLKYDSGTMVFE